MISNIRVKQSISQLETKILLQQEKLDMSVLSLSDENKLITDLDEKELDYYDKIWLKIYNYEVSHMREIKDKLIEYNIKLN